MNRTHWRSTSLNPRHFQEAPTESLLTGLVNPTQDPTLRAGQARAVEEKLTLLISEVGSRLPVARGFQYSYGDIAGLLSTTRRERPPRSGSAGHSPSFKAAGNVRWFPMRTPSS